MSTPAPIAKTLREAFEGLASSEQIKPEVRRQLVPAFDAGYHDQVDRWARSGAPLDGLAADVRRAVVRRRSRLQDAPTGDLPLAA